MSVTLVSSALGRQEIVNERGRRAHREEELKGLALATCPSLLRGQKRT
jgi:hypothetical protein